MSINPDEALRRVGLKVTNPRLRVLELLGQGQHQSAEQLYQRMHKTERDIGFATIYRVLNQLEAAGLILKHHFETGSAVYELNRGIQHHHMVDVETGTVIEFESEEIDALQQGVASKHGYAVVDHLLVLYVRRSEAQTVHARKSSQPCT